MARGAAPAQRGVAGPRRPKVGSPDEGGGESLLSREEPLVEGSGPPGSGRSLVPAGGRWFLRLVEYARVSAGSAGVRMVAIAPDRRWYAEGPGPTGVAGPRHDPSWVGRLGRRTEPLWRDRGLIVRLRSHVVPGRGAGSTFAALLRAYWAPVRRASEAVSRNSGGGGPARVGALALSSPHTDGAQRSGPVFGYATQRGMVRWTGCRRNTQTTGQAAPK
jgi:hypothetical protein